MMQRIPQIEPDTAPVAVGATLDAVKIRLGMVPNVFKTMAQAPAVLTGYLAFSGAIGTGKLLPKLREQIGLATAGANASAYCESIHSALGQMAGLAPDEIVRNLAGEASDPKSEAALFFARAIVVDRGIVSDADLAKVKAAGFSDEEIVEILANVSINIFTNYFNHLAVTDIDFPREQVEVACTAH